MRSNGYEFVLARAAPAVDLANFSIKGLDTYRHRCRDMRAPQDKFAALPREALQSCKSVSYDRLDAAARAHICAGEI